MWHPILFFPATIDIHPPLFFLWVQLENIYNEGTSVWVINFAYLGVVKAGIDFPAQSLLSIYIYGKSGLVSELEFLKRRKMQ